jgi:hypothetical protein
MKKYENLVNRVKAPIYVTADTKRLAIRMSTSLTMILIIELSISQDYRLGGGMGFLITLVEC